MYSTITLGARLSGNVRRQKRAAERCDPSISHIAIGPGILVYRYYVDNWLLFDDVRIKHLSISNRRNPHRYLRLWSCCRNIFLWHRIYIGSSWLFFNEAAVCNQSAINIGGVHDLRSRWNLYYRSDCKPISIVGSLVCISAWWAVWRLGRKNLRKYYPCLLTLNATDGRKRA